jgi:hypothetical protein
MDAFFPNMALRCSINGKEHAATFEKLNGHMIIVTSRGTLYKSLEEFVQKECGGTAEDDPWEICEFWKSWSWWKCKEMLPPIKG